MVFSIAFCFCTVLVENAIFVFSRGNVQLVVFDSPFLALTQFHHPLNYCKSFVDIFSLLKGLLGCSTNKIIQGVGDVFSRGNMQLVVFCDKFVISRGQIMIKDLILSTSLHNSYLGQPILSYLKLDGFCNIFVKVRKRL